MKTLKTELLRTFDVTKWVFSIYFKNYPVLVSIYVLTELILSLSNLFNAYIIALVTDKAIYLAQLGTSSVNDFIPIILLISGSYLVTQITHNKRSSLEYYRISKLVTTQNDAC